MKITIISPAYPFRGGIAQSTAILYRKLEERGHQASIINFKRQYPNFLFPGKSQFEPREDVRLEVENERIIDSVSPLSWIRTFKKIKHDNPDLVIIRYWMPFFAPCFGTICWLLKRFGAARILYICDNIIPHEKRFGDYALTKFALNYADFFILLSDFVKSHLLKLLNQPVFRVVPHPVFEIFGESIDKSRAKKDLAISEEKVILFFGLVRAYKGLNVLLNAMPAIINKFKVKLMIVGEFYEDEEKYRDLISKLEIEKSTYIENHFIEYEKVGLYFSAADVLVLPYRSATQSGIVQLAYHFNKPCIVTDVGGLTEAVVDGKTGFAVEPENPTAVANAVIRFYSENRENEFIENIKIEKKKFSWDRMVRTIEELVENQEG